MPMEHERRGRAPREMEAFSHTFLFADLVGFTALADREGDGRALDVALALQRRVRGLLERHGAEQVKAIGDGVMLRFSDARSAVRFGVRLLEELADEAGFPPVRVAIHTGAALSSDGDWYGRTVNVAARLCSLAPPGGVIVSDRARDAAGQIEGVSWSSGALRWLRNVSAPVGTYLVRRPRNTLARPDPSRSAEAGSRG
ncbi:MAG: adenylate/guanylate cyclase domain-containing protein [Solirubrobacterales bacterium]|nr:adenylate/guanylate cyclase domain-containing protein [Solirubrobacterales bacterium]MBV9424787.1 adenylate/guanylate cyclase domain-containing protein [Solirubrobacterales bacterium]MBV9799897.1 adenylate/guanylate cyclase domain-containing protein [Solirubrobacterales bacterium]